MTGAGTTSFAVSLKAAGVSLLAAKLTVLNSAGAVLGTATAADPAKGDLTINVSGATAGATYYVRVEKGSDANFAVGGYRLAAGVGTGAQTAINDPVMSGVVKADGHGNDQMASATNLGTQVGAAGPRWDFTARATVGDTTDVDFYKVTTGAAPGAPVVAAWGTKVGGVDPVVTVYNAAQQVVAVEVLTNDAGAYVVQVKTPTANSTYYVKVAGDPKTGVRTGTYVLGVDFRAAAVVPQRLSATTLTAAAPQAAASITVYQSQLFHFALSTTTANAAVASAVRLSVRDSSGKEVYTLFANAGDRVSGDTLLGPGTYTLVFTAGTQTTGVSLPSLSYTLDGMVRSDPIGLTPTDTSGTTTPPKTTTTTIYTGPYTSPYRLL